MGKKIPFFFIFMAGCLPSGTHYPPVNWNSIPAPPRSQSPEPAPDIQTQSVAERLLVLHNQQRELKGRPGLTIDPELNKYAQMWANNMAKRNSLYHSKLTFFNDGHYHTAGENIAWNQTTPEQATNDWMNSPGHRDNIMNRSFTHVGFAVAYNSKNEPYWCTVFGG